MSFIDINLNTIPDKVTIPAQECMLSIEAAELKEAKSEAKTKYLALRFRVSKRGDGGNAAEAYDINFNLFPPDPNGADMSKESSKKARWVAFFEALKMDPSHVELESLVGKQVWALLKLTPASTAADGQSYPAKNEIDKIVGAA